MPSGSALRRNSFRSLSIVRAWAVALLALVPTLSLAQQPSSGSPHATPGTNQAPVIYIVGAVRNPGKYPLGQHQTVDLFQALALAGGLTETARASAARVIHWRSDGPPVEIPVNLRKSAPDETIELGSGDVLLIPDSKPRTNPLSPWDPAAAAGPAHTQLRVPGGAPCLVVVNS
jgi:hypothetical protein